MSIQYTTSRVTIFALAIVCALSGGAALLANGTLTGRVRFEKIKGRPSLGHVELYETNLFACPDGGATIGPSFRVGAPPGQAPRGDGFYSLSLAAGTWSLMLNQPLFFIRPKVLSGITVTNGRTTTEHVEIPIDYSTYFVDSWTGFDRVWTQTFVATGTSITGVSWKLAGTNATSIEASVLEEVAGESNPNRWRLVSPSARKSDSVATIADNWVRWRSGEVPTVPGRTYAIRLNGVNGGDLKYAVFKRDKDANSYSGGRAWDSAGRAQGFDLNITVFSDNDGTAVLYNKTTEGLGDLRDGYYGGRWGQTFKATQGSSLAAVDVWAAGADRNWDLDFTFSVYRGGPGGARVGPTKTTKAAFQAFGAGLHAVSYNPGEVPLVPGETYYVEFTGSPGFNPYVMNEARDAYPNGAAYQDRALKDGGSVDLSMTIVVHDAPDGGGTIAGVCRDSTGGRPLSGTTVTITRLGRSAVTNGDGEYELASVPAGTYTLRAEKPGYDAESRAGVTVDDGATTTADFELDRQACGVNFRNESFESSLVGWTRYGDARDRVVDTSGGGWFGGIEAFDGSRFHGNEVNGCCMNGGLFQRFCAVPGHRYRVTVWSNVYWLSGGSSVAANRLGVSPDGGTNPDSGTVEWSALHRQSREGVEQWRRIALEVDAEGPIMTVFLDFKQTASGGNQWRINCFDLVEIEDLDAELEPGFVRGDCDGGTVRDLSDAIFLLGHLFQTPRELGCRDACDINDDGGLDLSDPVYLLNHLFLGGAGIPDPGEDCAPDPTADEIDCAETQCAT